MAFTEQLTEAGIDAFIGTIGDSCALAETVEGLCKTKLIKPCLQRSVTSSGSTNGAAELGLEDQIAHRSEVVAMRAETNHPAVDTRCCRHRCMVL